MSLKAILWAMDDAPVGDAQTLLVLIALCERADETGCNAWPSVEWLAGRGRCSARTVHRHLRLLEEAGVIVRGDQRLVQHLRADRRPTVWDVPGVRGDNVTPREDERGVTGDVHGVTPGASRGDTGGRQYVLPPTGETVQENTSNACATPSGVDATFAEFWAAYPRRIGKAAARRSYGRVVAKAGHPAIMAGLALAVADWGARRTEVQYIPHPTTWLNQGRWEDDVQVPTRTTDRTAYADAWSTGGAGFFDEVDL